MRPAAQQGVEAVEKVQTEWLRSVNAKNDLSECARIDASTRGMGKRTPENKSIPASRTFPTASLAGSMKRSTTTLVGASGEHYVAAYLSGFQLIVAMPRAGIPGSDLFVSKEKGGHVLRVQVKTGTQ